MRHGWERATLGASFTTVTGNTPPKNNAILYGNFIPLVKPPELCYSVVDSAEDGLSEFGAKIARIAPPNSILVSCIGNLGKVGLNSIAVGFNQQINAILPNSRRSVPEFMFYQAMSQSFKQQLEDFSSGTTVPIVNKSKFNAIKIVLPPISEQKRIVAILDEAFEGIAAASANAERNQASARELFENYLNMTFIQRGKGWVKKDLSDVCDITSKLVDPREPQFIDLPHLGAGNIVSRTGELIAIQTAREEGLISGKFLFDTTMVLYSKIRPYLMKVARPDFSGLCSADVYPLSPNRDRLDRNFLFHMLMSRNFTDYAIEGSDRAGMPKVNRDHLFRYSVWLPTIDEQTRLAAKLDAISAEAQRLEAIYQQKLNALAELKQAVLQKAFSGELTAQPERILQQAVA